MQWFYLFHMSYLKFIPNPCIVKWISKWWVLIKFWENPQIHHDCQPYEIINCFQDSYDLSLCYFYPYSQKEWNYYSFTAHHQIRVPGSLEAQNRSLQIVIDLDTVELWNNQSTYLSGRYRRYCWWNPQREDTNCKRQRQWAHPSRYQRIIQGNSQDND